MTPYPLPITHYPLPLSHQSSDLKLDHIGIAVRDLEVALKYYRALGLEPSTREVVAGEGVEVVVLPLGGTRLELLRPLGEDTPAGRFIAKRGEGLHHIGLAVPDIRVTLARCKAAGLELIDDEPHPGAEGRLVAFVHPKSAGGVLIELTEESKRVSE